MIVVAEGPDDRIKINNVEGKLPVHYEAPLNGDSHLSNDGAKLPKIGARYDLIIGIFKAKGAQLRSFGKDPLGRSIFGDKACALNVKGDPQQTPRKKNPIAIEKK